MRVVGQASRSIRAPYPVSLQARSPLAFSVRVQDLPALSPSRSNRRVRPGRTARLRGPDVLRYTGTVGRTGQTENKRKSCQEEFFIVVSRLRGLRPPRISSSTVRQSDYDRLCRARPAAEDYARNQLDVPDQPDKSHSDNMNDAA